MAGLVKHKRNEKKDIRKLIRERSDTDPDRLEYRRCELAREVSLLEANLEKCRSEMDTMSLSPQEKLANVTRIAQAKSSLLTLSSLSLVVDMLSVRVEIPRLDAAGNPVMKANNKPRVDETRASAAAIMLEIWKGVQEEDEEDTPNAAPPMEPWQIQLLATLDAINKRLAFNQAARGITPAPAQASGGVPPMPRAVRT